MDSTVGLIVAQMRQMASGDQTFSVVVSKSQLKAWADDLEGAKKKSDAELDRTVVELDEWRQNGRAPGIMY
jgi:hypothetical protein